MSGFLHGAFEILIQKKHVNSLQGGPILPVLPRVISPL